MHLGTIYQSIYKSENSIGRGKQFLNSYFSVCVLEATPYGAKKIFPAYSLSLPVVMGNNMAPRIELSLPNASYALLGFVLSL